MILAAVAFVSQLLLVLFPGLVLHRALARRILALDADKSAYDINEVDLLAFGLLPGLALANTVGTLLAIVHLFYWWAYLAVIFILLGWRWRDGLATLVAMEIVFRESYRSLLRGNLMVVVAFAIFLQTLAGMLVEALMPWSSTDVWFHNLPLAQSIVAHHGFVMPQIDNMFYGTYPIFFHMFFAEGLLFVNGVIAAKAASAMIYLCFLLSLLAFVRQGRAVFAVLVSIAIVNSSFFSNGAADGMTDIGRVCFSALAFAFGYQYFRTRRLYFLFASGLLAGGAIAGKYTELLTPLLIGVSLLPGVIGRKQDSWLAVAVFTVATAVTGTYPYLRNLIVFHNPIYPFFFGHPGITDERMRGLQEEVFRLANPAFSTYSLNPFSLQAWRDFADATWQVFLSNWNLTGYAFAVIVLGLIGLRSRALIHFFFWTLAMWIFWYTLGRMNARWGKTAFMLFSILPLLVIADFIDRGAGWIASLGNKWPLPAWSRAGKAPLRLISARMTPTSVLRIAVAVWALYIGQDAIRRINISGWSAAFPPWLDKGAARAVLQPGGIKNYLLATREGYEMYRYIGEHDLRMVLQPFDNGAVLYQSAYNEGSNGGWILTWNVMPKDPSEFDAFIQKNKVRYFIYRQSLPPGRAEGLALGSGNPRHAEIAFELMDYLLPGSRLLLTDHFGWELREIAPEKLK